MGKIDTMELLIIAGVGLVAVYFLMKPSTPAVVTTTALPKTTTTSSSAENTAITTGGSVANTLINNLL